MGFKGIIQLNLKKQKKDKNNVLLNVLWVKQAFYKHTNKPKQTNKKLIFVYLYLYVYLEGILPGWRHESWLVRVTIHFF